MIQSDGATAGEHENVKPDEAAKGATGTEHHEASAQDAGGQETVSQEASGEETVSHDAGNPDAVKQDAVSLEAGGQEMVSQDSGGQDSGGQDTGSQDSGGKEIECAKSGAVTSVVTDIEPFLAAAGERIEQPHAERPFYSKLLDYSAHAAMIVGLLGFAWTLSAHTGKQPDAPLPPAKTALLAPSAVASTGAASAQETAELRPDAQKMAADIAALRQNLEALRSGMHGDAQRQDKTIEQIKALAANLDGVKAGLSATKTETTAALTQLSGKIDHLQHGESLTKVQQVTASAGRTEHDGVDQIVTATLAPAPAARPTPVAVPPVKSQVAKAEVPDSAKKPVVPTTGEDASKKPQIIPEWVVREVDDGVAIVESRRGQLAVETGGTIPGAGVVKSIERHGASWTVTTSKGQLAYVPLRDQQPPREYSHSYYRGGPEDF